MDISEDRFFSSKSLQFLEYVSGAAGLSCAERFRKADATELADLIVTYPAELAENKNFLTSLMEAWEKFERQLCWHGKKGSIRIMPDSEISDRDLETSSFVIYDTPGSRVFSRHLPTFPLKIDGEKINGGGAVFEGANLQVSITVPSPFNQKKILTVVRATTPFPRSLATGLWVPSPNTYVISRVGMRLKNVETGCFEHNPRKERLEFLTGDNFEDEIDWVCMKSEHHVFCFRAGSIAREELSRIVKIHEDSYVEFLGKLGLKRRQRDTFLCYLHEQKNKKVKCNVFLPAFSELHMIYNDKTRLEDYAGPHELVHAISSSRFGNGVPLLLDEGLAEFLTWKDEKPIEYYSTKMLNSGALVDFKALVEPENFKKYWSSDTYKQSASFVKFLVERYGMGRFTQLMRSAGKKHPLSLTVFDAVYNKTLHDLEKEWKSALRSYFQRHREEIGEMFPLVKAQRKFFYKDYAGALEEVNRSIAADNNDPYKLYLAGRCHFFMENMGEALECFEKALAMPLAAQGDEFVHLGSYLYTGKIHDLRGERESAKLNYSMVLEGEEVYELRSKAEQYLSSPYAKGADRDTI